MSTVSSSGSFNSSALFSSTWPVEFAAGSGFSSISTGLEVTGSYNSSAPVWPWPVEFTAGLEFSSSSSGLEGTGSSVTSALLWSD